MKPRVLLLSTAHPPTDPRIVYKIAPSLSRNYEVICVLPNLTDQHAKGDIRYINLPYFKGLLSRILFCHSVLLWKCVRFRPAIVHIFVPELIPIAFLMHWLGAKIVYEVQENLYKKFAIKRYNNAVLYRQLFNFFDHIARKKFFCLFTEDAYLNEYSDLALPHAVVHNYVSLPFIDAYGTKKQELNNPPVFFYSGVVSLERSFDTILEALAMLQIKYPEFHLHLFGKVQFDWREVKNNPHYGKIQHNLTFHGYTDLRKVLPYAQGAVAGIALLKPVADYSESYTTKLFEYMALSLPVITSDFPLYKEVVEKSNCGFCISPYDPKELSDAFQWLIENPEPAKLMGQRGRKTVEDKYNWANEEQILHRFYKNLIKI
jgi:glycosyltransferase involved in cell wall biosynthesis